ncbi:MAG: hypothetical protein SGJ15_13910 [Bacteroidota bacterium]|nr:hypothetical protein [Bacteroidota bacterium]
MEINIKKIIPLLALVLVFTTCKKNKLGGDCVIEGIVKHHTKIIKGASVFIKFKAIDQPAGDTTVYDAKVRADDNGYFKFDVYKGKYFIYGFGYDYGIPAPYTVVGGQPVKVRSKETVSITLYITDGD